MLTSLLVTGVPSYFGHACFMKKFLPDLGGPKTTPFIYTYTEGRDGISGGGELELFSGDLHHANNLFPILFTIN